MLSWAKACGFKKNYTPLCFFKICAITFTTWKEWKNHFSLESFVWFYQNQKHYMIIHIHIIKVKMTDSIILIVIYNYFHYPYNSVRIKETKPNLCHKNFIFKHRFQLWISKMIVIENPTVVSIWSLYTQKVNNAFSY